MTTPTTNYSWPKPQPTEYASITGINALTDAMDTSIKSVADGMGAVIKPIVQMKLNGTVTPGNLSTTSLIGTNFWEEVFSVDGTVSGGSSPTGQPIVFTTTGWITVYTPGIYRLTYTINVGTAPSAVEGWWMTSLYDANGIIVPRTRQVERMQTYTFGQGLHHSVLLKADTTGSPDLAAGTMSYKLAIRHDVNAASTFISCKPSDLDPYFSCATVEYVRGL